MAPATDPDPIADLRAMRVSLRVLVATVVVLGGMILALAFFAWGTAETLRKGTCNLRDDLNARIENSREFLRERPEIFQELGIDPAVIREDIRNQQRTADALGDIRC